MGDIPMEGAVPLDSEEAEDSGFTFIELTTEEKELLIDGSVNPAL